MVFYMACIFYVGSKISSTFAYFATVVILYCNSFSDSQEQSVCVKIPQILLLVPRFYIV